MCAININSLLLLRARFRSFCASAAPRSVTPPRNITLSSMAAGIAPGPMSSTAKAGETEMKYPPVAAESAESTESTEIVVQKGDVVVLSADFPIKHPIRARDGPCHMPKRMLAVVERVGSVLKDVSVRAAAPVDLGPNASEFRYRRLTVAEEHAGRLRRAPCKDELLWRLKGLVFTALWLGVPAGAIAGGTSASLAVWQQAGSGAGLGASLVLFVVLPILLSIGRSIYVCKRHDENECAMGCAVITFVLWITFCLAPIVGVLTAGPLNEYREQISSGGSASGISLLVNEAPKSAAALEFVRGTFVDTRRAGAYHEQFGSRPYFQFFFCLAPLSAAGLDANAPVQYWAYEMNLMSTAAAENSLPYGPCWVGYQSISHAGVAATYSGTLKALSVGQQRYTRFSGGRDITASVARAKADAIATFNLTEHADAKIVSIEGALSGPGSLSSSLSTMVQHAIFWSIVVGKRLATISPRRRVRSIDSAHQPGVRITCHRTPYVLDLSCILLLPQLHTRGRRAWFPSRVSTESMLRHVRRPADVRPPHVCRLRLSEALTRASRQV